MVCKERDTYPELTGALEMAMLSGVSAFTYDSVMAKYCGDKSSSSIVMGAGDCIVTQNKRQGLGKRHLYGRAVKGRSTRSKRRKKCPPTTWLDSQLG